MYLFIFSNLTGVNLTNGGGGGGGNGVNGPISGMHHNERERERERDRVNNIGSAPQGGVIPLHESGGNSNMRGTTPVPFSAAGI